jgi:hypothetical protein
MHCSEIGENICRINEKFDLHREANHGYFYAETLKSIIA